MKEASNSSLLVSHSSNKYHNSNIVICGLVFFIKKKKKKSKIRKINIQLVMSFKLALDHDTTKICQIEMAKKTMEALA